LFRQLKTLQTNVRGSRVTEGRLTRFLR